MPSGFWKKRSQKATEPKSSAPGWTSPAWTDGDQTIMEGRLNSNNLSLTDLRDGVKNLRENVNLTKAQLLALEIYLVQEVKTLGDSMHAIAVNGDIVEEII